jgi:hypothetical protein
MLSDFNIIHSLEFLGARQGLPPKIADILCNEKRENPAARIWCRVFFLIGSAIVFQTGSMDGDFEAHPGAVDLSGCYGSQNLLNETGSHATWNNLFAMTAINIAVVCAAHSSTFVLLFDNFDEPTGLNECFEFFGDFVIPEASAPDVRFVSLTFDTKLVAGLVSVASPTFS